MWYSQGTITATNNSTVITGVGTGFLQGVRVGDGITIAGSTSLHEVISVASNTQLTIRPAYAGTTGSGKQYAVAPILGYDKDLSDAFNQLRLQFGNQLSSLQPWAHAATASAALDSLGFSSSGKSVATGTASQGRTALGLGTAATRGVAIRSEAVAGTANVLPDAAGVHAAFKRYGLGLGPSEELWDLNDLDMNALPPNVNTSGFHGHNAGAAATGSPTNFATAYLFLREQASQNFQIAMVRNSNKYFMRTNTNAWDELHHSGNTTVDSNGTLKASSPVINLYTSEHDLHNEGQFGATPEVVRKSKGVYEITGTLGLRSEGWYLDTPSDRNGNKYFNVEWAQNITADAADGVVDEYRDDIIVTIETFERVWNKDTGLFENGAPIDINELQDRFVQLRFNELKVEELDDES